MLQNYSSQVTILSIYYFQKYLQKYFRVNPIFLYIGMEAVILSCTNETNENLCWINSLTSSMNRYFLLVTQPFPFALMKPGKTT